MEALHNRRWHRCATRINLRQGFEVVTHDFLRLEQGDKNSRGSNREGGICLAHRVAKKRDLEAVRQHQRRRYPQGCGQIGQHARHMDQRRNRQDDIVARQRHPLPVYLDALCHVGMGTDDAFGRTGGARGVDQGGNIEASRPRLVDRGAGQTGGHQRLEVLRCQRTACSARQRRAIGRAKRPCIMARLVSACVASQNTNHTGLVRHVMRHLMRRLQRHAQLVACMADQHLGATVRQNLMQLA